VPINSQQSELMSQLMNINEVAHLLHVHPTSVRRWLKSGALEAFRIGPKGSFRFKRESILKFIERQKEVLSTSKSTT
jgi:excisionase family DNA binding protein